MQLSLPTARTTDPDTSRDAAESVKPANPLLVQLIRAVLDTSSDLAHEQIVYLVGELYPGRWTQGTIVSACARAHLVQVGRVRNARGRWVATWTTR